MSKTEKTKEVNQKNIEGKPTPDDITPILILMAGIFIFTGMMFAFFHPPINCSIIVMNFYGYGLILFGLFCLFLYVSDMWFIGPRIDPVYKEKILKTVEESGKFKLIPYWRQIAKLRPSRTAAYSWGIVSKKFREKDIFGGDDLKVEASKMTIILAWLTIMTFFVSIVVLFVGAVLD